MNKSGAAVERGPTVRRRRVRRAPSREPFTVYTFSLYPPSTACKKWYCSDCTGSAVPGSDERHHTSPDRPAAKQTRALPRQPASAPYRRAGPGIGPAQVSGVCRPSTHARVRHSQSTGPSALRRAGAGAARRSLGSPGARDSRHSPRRLGQPRQAPAPACRCSCRGRCAAAATRLPPRTPRPYRPPAGQWHGLGQ